MKIVVQNGSSNPLTRKDVENIVEILPGSLKKGIRSICLYGSTKDQPTVTYHAKEEALGIHAAVCSKSAVVEELVISLVLLSAFGNIPNRLGCHARQKCLAENSQLLTQCQKVIGYVSAT